MSTSVAFLGAGSMGTGMVQCLLAKGHQVTVWNRSPGKHDALRDLGATLVPDMRETAASSDIVIGCLLNTAVTRECYLGDQGVVRNARPGQTFVEHGTFDPSLAVEIADAARAVGCDFLDAPVTGGPERARSGELVVMVGGAMSALARVQEEIASYAKKVALVGDIGSGLRLKLINQLLVSIHVVAAAEASALVMREGLDPHVAHSVLMGGWAASAMLDREMPKACARNFADTGATVGKLVEVQPMITALLARAGVESRLFGPARAAFDLAMESGAADLDLAAIVAGYLPTPQQDAFPQ